MCVCQKSTHSPTNNTNRNSNQSNQSDKSGTDCEILELEVVIMITEVADLSGVSGFLSAIVIMNSESLKIESALVNVIAEERIDIIDFEYSEKDNGSIVFALDNGIEYDPETDSMIISIVTESGSHHCIKNIYS